MKAKLTISVDKQLIPLAKQSARRRGKSLSSVIEDALRESVRGGEPSFVQHWRGQFRPRGRASARYRVLAKKHL